MRMPNKREAYEAHTNRWSRCHVCTIGRWAFKHAFGVGNFDAPFVFVGEGPGASEDALGIPFCGKAGRLLQRALHAAGWSAEDWFLTNLVACHPTDAAGGGNRAPTSAEVANCGPRLRQLLDVVAPKIIVAVGNVPAEYLLSNISLMSAGIRYEKIKHPAWLLRQGGEVSAEWVPYVEALKRLRRIVYAGTKNFAS